MAKILVLHTHDTHLGGHGWSIYKRLENLGHKVCFVSLFRRNKGTENSFYSLMSFWGASYYYLTFYLRDLFVKKVLLRPDARYAFVSSYLWGKSAKSILQKCTFQPDYIVITWVPGFITPKTVRDLYNITGAKIVFDMVDQALLSLCHYHKECYEYKNGCKRCPHVKGLKFLPRYNMEQKTKWWNNMPADIVCTTYDKNHAMQVPFLKKMNYFISITVPSCGNVYSKKEARKFFNICEDDFVIFLGSNNAANPDKGYPYVVDSINRMIAKINDSKKKTTLLILGHNALTLKLNLDQSVNVVRRDFLPYEHFFKAYYACDVHASATLYDSGPMMVNYSLACGRPVVSFPVGVALDLIEDGRTGFIVPYKDTSSFAEALYKLYNCSDKEFDEISRNCVDKMDSYRGKDYWTQL